MGDEGADDAGEHIALAAVGHVGAAGAVVDKVGEGGRGDDGAGAFVQEGTGGLLQEAAHGFCTGEGGGWGEEAAHFAGVRGEDGGFGDVPVVFGGKVEGVGIEHDGAAEVVEQAVQGLSLGDAGPADTGADDEGLGGVCGDLGVGLDGVYHDLGCDARGEDGVYLFFAVQGNQPGTGGHGGICTQLCSADVAYTAGDDVDPAHFVFVEGVGAGRQGGVAGVGYHGCLGIRQGERGERDAEQAAHEVLCPVYEHAGFYAADGGGYIGLDGAAEDLAGVGLQAGGDVDGEDERVGVIAAQGVYFFYHGGIFGAQGAGYPAAQQAIDDEQAAAALQNVCSRRGVLLRAVLAFFVLAAGSGREVGGVAYGTDLHMAPEAGGQADGVAGVVAFAGIDDDALNFAGGEFGVVLQGVPQAVYCGIHQLVGSGNTCGDAALLCLAYHGAWVYIHGVISFWFVKLCFLPGAMLCGRLRVLYKKIAKESKGNTGYEIEG